MIRNLPDGQRGQRSRSRAKTRLSQRAHAQRDATGLAGVSIPRWRGVGVMAPRRWRCAAKQPAYRTWCTRGGGTNADSFSSYEVFVNQRIVAVNDQKIRNLRELVRAVEQPASDPFIVLTTENNARLVFDRAQAQRDHRPILETYDIAWDRSEDLRWPSMEHGITFS